MVESFIKMPLNVPPVMVPLFCRVMSANVPPLISPLFTKITLDKFCTLASTTLASSSTTTAFNPKLARPISVKSKFWPVMVSVRP